MKKLACVTWFLAAAAAGCDDSETTGELTVLAEAEDVIQQGLEAGNGAGEIADGWDVQFERYMVVLGHVELEQSSGSGEQHADVSYIVDLTAIPAAGQPLFTETGLESGRWEFYYSVLAATDESEVDSSADRDEAAEMVAEGWSYLIEGEMTNASGQSCPPAALADVGSATPNGQTNDRGDDCYDLAEVHFHFGAAVDAEYGPCELDEVPGVNVPDNGTATAALSIHGDHIFFNGFPEGSEGGITRLAQWLADCDLNQDGEITSAELAQIRPADLAEFDDRFQLGGSPIELQDMWDYLLAQLMTQGHFQGEGECPVNGMVHEHGHEEDEHEHE